MGDRLPGFHAAMGLHGLVASMAVLASLSRRRSTHMRLEDLDPKTAALLDLATRDELLPVLREMIRDERDLEPRLFVIKHGGLHEFGVLVLGVAACDTVVREIELPVVWSAISERARAAVALVWAQHLSALNDRRVRQLNIKLVAHGIAPIKLPASSS